MQFSSLAVVTTIKKDIDGLIMLIILKGNIYGIRCIKLQRINTTLSLLPIHL